MILGVASGKGGTGKTTVAVNLARMAGSDVLLADCDVEEPNDHLVMVKELTLPFGVVLNRVGIGDDRVHAYCRREEIPILQEIPDDRRIAEAYSRGKLIVDELPEYRPLFAELNRRAEALAAQPALGVQPTSTWCCVPMSGRATNSGAATRPSSALTRAPAAAAVKSIARSTRSRRTRPPTMAHRPSSSAPCPGMTDRLVTLALR
jgi:hypothetical protein